jgi:HEAT repeat protein
MRHLLGLVAAFAGLFAVLRYREEVYDPASAEARRLRAFDPAERIEAVGKLLAMGREAESAIPSLLGALDDGDHRVRARAAMAIPSIVTAPDHPRADDARAALTAAVADPDPGARHAAAVALGVLSTDSKFLRPVLSEAVGDADPDVRSLAVGLLAPSLHDEAAWAAVLPAIRDPDVKVRYAAVRALGWMPNPARLAAVREALAPALKDAHEVVRGGVAITLGQYARKVPADFQELNDLLADPSPHVRALVCAFMPHHAGWRVGIAALVRTLADPDPRVRLAAAQRLGRIGLDAEEALPDLRRAAEDKENSVRDAASEAIRTIEAKARDFRTKVLMIDPQGLPISPGTDLHRAMTALMWRRVPPLGNAAHPLNRKQESGELQFRDGTRTIPPASKCGLPGRDRCDARPSWLSAEARSS